MYGDIVAVLMIFELVKLHPPSSIMRSVIHQVMTRLIVVYEVSKLGGNMWLRGTNGLVLWVFYNYNTSMWQHCILHVVTSETRHNNQLLAYDPLEFADDVCPISNIER